MKQNWERQKKQEKEKNTDESGLVKMRYQI